MALFGRKKKDEKEDNVKPPEEVREESVQEKQLEVKVPKDGDEHAYAAIIFPYMTEKANLGAQERKYVFRVTERSTKIEIRKAIEKMYKVKVQKVAIAMKPSKTRVMGKHEGVKQGFKKAIVTLAEGYKIDIIS